MKSPSHLDAPPAPASAQCSCQPASHSPAHKPSTAPYCSQEVIKAFTIQNLWRIISPPTSSYTVTLPGPCRLLLRLQFTSASLKHFPTGPQVPPSSHLPLLLGPFWFLLNSDLAFESLLHPYSLPGHLPLAPLSIPPTRPDTCLYMSRSSLLPPNPTQASSHLWRHLPTSICIPALLSAHVVQDLSPKPPSCGGAFYICLPV